MNDLGIKEPVAVFGVGVEGRSVVEYLARHGLKDIIALDRNEVKDLPAGVKSICGEDHSKGFERYATVFRSPGIRPDHPSLETLRASGGCVTSTIAFFLERCPAPVVGVTGTLGKGTASSLIAKILGDAGFDTHLGGNIGASPLTFLDDLKDTSRVVLELSSFQCMDLKVSPKVGVVLKTTSEHLDWHLNLDEYLDAKANLLANQKPGDLSVYNADASGSCRVASRSSKKIAYSVERSVEEGVFLKDDQLVLRSDDEEQILPVDIDKVRLPGRFNLENISAGILAAVSVGSDLETACATSEAFEGLPHRVEFVSKGKDILFYNDSYATRPDAALGALSCFTDAPLALILGGSEKHADFGQLALGIIKHPSIVKVCLIGATSKRLRDAIDGAGVAGFDIEEYEDLEPAMEGAVAALDNEGVVLLSPACASFGLFPNYKVRGERFRAKAIEQANGLDL